MNDKSDLISRYAADEWVAAAGALPLAFAQVREDPRLDLEVMSRIRAGGDVVMIASGGETAVCLSRLPIRSLVLVDMNPAQLELARLKIHLSQSHPPQEAMEILGHLPLDTAARRQRWEGLCAEIGLATNVFGPVDSIVQWGPDHAGRYERLFAQLCHELSAQGVSLSELLAAAPGSALALDNALAKVMSLPNLVGLFGPEATQNPRKPFHEHFGERIREALRNEAAPAINPFLWQMLAGTFAPMSPYDWLDETIQEQPIKPEIRQVRGKMREVLDDMQEQSADFVHLSNILDWLSPNQATDCLRSARRVLRPGGWVIVRQLNSSLEIPGLESGLRWDLGWGGKLQTRDRSFFYPAIHVGQRA